MAQTESILLAPLPRSLVKFVTPIAALLLTAFFILLDFPYHHLTTRVTAAASQALEVEIDAAESGLTFGIDGIGFRFDDIRVETPSGDVYDLDSARLGAGWSTSWLLATPTIFFEVTSSFGGAKGSFRMGDDMSGSGTITDATLGELKFLEPLLPARITGTLSAEGDIETRDGLPHGPVSFNLRDGSISYPALPIDIPFTALDGRLSFGGDQFLDVESFELHGPMLNLSISGKIAHPGTNGDRGLDLDLVIKDVAPDIRSMVQLLGASPGKGGNMRLHIGGSLNNPNIK